jgi:hypothetical protein
MAKMCQNIINFPNGNVHIRFKKKGGRNSTKRTEKMREVGEGV